MDLSDTPATRATEAIMRAFSGHSGNAIKPLGTSDYNKVFSHVHRTLTKHMENAPNVAPELTDKIFTAEETWKMAALTKSSGYEHRKWKRANKLTYDIIIQAIEAYGDQFKPYIGDGTRQDVP